jgi:hypothetical protein
MDLYRDLRQVFICLRPPPLLGFCLGWSSNIPVLNLVRHIVLKSYRIWSPTGLNTPTHSQPHNVCIHCTLTQGREGRVGVS